MRRKRTPVRHRRLMPKSYSKTRKLWKKGSKSYLLTNLQSEILNELISDINQILPGLTDPEYCPLTELTTFYELFYSTIIDQDEKISLLPYIATFNGLIQQLRKRSHIHSKDSKHSSLDLKELIILGSHFWRRFKELCDLYTEITFLKLFFLTETRITITSYESNKYKVNIHSFHKENIGFSFSSGFLFNLVIDLPSDRILVPIKEQQAFSEEFEALDYNRLVERMKKWGKLHLDQMFKHVDFHIPQKFDFNNQIEFLKFFYNFSLMVRLGNKDLKRIVVPCLSEILIIKYFLKYTSREESDTNLITDLDRFYENIQKSWYIPFSPIFPCFGKKNEKRWILSPSYFIAINQRYIENFIHLIYEQGKIKGTYMEEILSSKFKQFKFSPWDVESVKMLNEFVRIHPSGKDGDIDLVLPSDEKTLILVQCKAIKPHSRKTFRNRVSKGVKQVYSTLQTLDSHLPEFQKQFKSSYESFHGLIITSCIFPMNFNHDRNRIDLIDVESLLDILNSITSSHNIIKLIKHKHKQIKSEWSKKPAKSPEISVSRYQIQIAHYLKN